MSNEADDALLKAVADSEVDSMNQSEVYAAVRALARAAVGWTEPAPPAEEPAPEEPTPEELPPAA
jgi:hypothetical protein